MSTDARRPSTVHVDFVDTSLPGRLGMTACPGRRAALADDLGELRRDGVDLLVCMLEREEMVRLDVAELPAEAVRAGLDVLHVPTIDGGVPAERSLVAAVERVLAVLSAGRTAVVHCRAGLGRTGSFAACCLVASGVAARRAMASVRLIRPGAIETLAQERLVMSFAESWESRR